MKDRIKLFLCELCVWAVILLGAFLFALLLSGCASSKPSVNGEPPKEKDSLNIVTLYEVIEVFDTTFIELPKQTAERVTADSTSTLENDFAKSTATIKPDGSLYHSLETKPQPVPIPTKKRIERKDSIRVETKWRTRTITKEVERKKTWWEQTKSYGFYVLVLLTLFRYRKKIWKVLMAIKV